jgi:copper homeostasis protein
MARDPYQALEDQIALGVDRVLTSGQQPSVLEGLDLIADLVRVAGDRVIVMPGGGAERNLAKIVAQSRVREVHVAGTTAVDSQMRYRNQRVFMGGELRPPEYTRFITDPELISELRKIR